MAWPLDGDESTTKKQIRKMDEYALKHFEQHMGGFDTKVSDLFVDLYCDYIVKQDAYNSNKYLHFKNILKSRGFLDSDSIQMSSNISKKVKQLAVEYDDKTFKAEEHLDGKLNQILKMDINQIRRYSHLFNNNYDATKHFNICKLLLTSADKKQNLITDLKYTRDSIIKKIQSIDSRVNFVNKVMTHIGFHVDSKNTFQCMRAYSKSQNVALFEEYCMIFNHKGKNPLVFTSKQECLKNVYKFVTNSMLFDNQLATSKSIKRDGKPMKLYTLNTDVLAHHREIQDIRKCDAEPDRCIIDDDNNDSSQQSIENFGIDINTEPVDKEVNEELKRKWVDFGFTFGQQQCGCGCDYCNKL
jgi:hypothetical protein